MTKADCTRLRGTWAELDPGAAPMLETLLGNPDDSRPIVVGTKRALTPLHTIRLECRLCRGPVWFGPMDKATLDQYPEHVPLDSECLEALTEGA